MALDEQTIVLEIGIMATLKDAACQTGFSVAIVSRALNPRPDPHARVSAATRRLAARKLICMINGNEVSAVSILPHLMICESA